MVDKASFTLEAARKIARMYREWNASGMDFQQARQVVAAPSENGPFIGIAQEDIDPNTSGDFKFARGTKGSEEAYGNAYAGYYRASSGAIKEDDYIYVSWISDGWEVKPCKFAKHTRIVITQEDISANTSGSCKFVHGPKGGEIEYGDAEDMFWRTEDGLEIPSGTKCYATWVDTGEDHSDWELDPIGCLDG